MWKELKSNLLAALIVSGIALGGAVTVTGSQFFTSITGGSASFVFTDAGILVADSLRTTTGAGNNAINMTAGSFVCFNYPTCTSFIRAGSLTTTSALSPDSNNAYDFGGPSAQWRHSYFSGEMFSASVDAGQLNVANNATIAGTLNIGSGGPIKKIIPCPRIDWDFASIIPRPGFIQVTDKATCTGVTPGDPCFIGVTKATPEDGGSAWEDNVRFDGIAVGVNKVQVRLNTLSGDGGAMNPPDAGYLITCISNQ